MSNILTTDNTCTFDDLKKGDCFRYLTTPNHRVYMKIGNGDVADLWDGTHYPNQTGSGLVIRVEKVTIERKV